MTRYAGRAGVVPPVADPWAEELWNRYQRGQLAGWQQRWLMKRDLKMSIVTRSRWLAGEPLALYLTDSWYSRSDKRRELRIRIVGTTGADAVWDMPVRPAPPPGAAAGAARGGGGRPLTVRMLAGPYTIGVPTDPMATMLAVELREFEDNADQTGRLILDKSVLVPLELTTQPNEILQPESSETLDEMLRSALAIEVILNGDRSTSISSISPTSPRGRNIFTELDGLALGMTIDFVCDGELIASSITRPRNQWSTKTFSKLTGDLDRLAEADLSDPSWKIVVKGYPQTSIRDHEATKYWSGEIELPGSVVTIRPPARPVK